MSNNQYDLFDNMINTITIGSGFQSPIYSVTGNYNWGTNVAFDDIVHPLIVKGDADISGDLKIKGKSIGDAIERIEERLAILHIDSRLEEKWEELKALGEKYRELEKDILEKEKIWDTLHK